MRGLKKNGTENGLYKIESGVPLPSGEGPMSKLRKYPWYEMKVGDSFFVPKKPPSYVKQAAEKVMKDHKEIKFVVRPDGNGVRCWRSQ